MPPFLAQFVQWVDAVCSMWTPRACRRCEETMSGQEAAGPPLGHKLGPTVHLMHGNPPIVRLAPPRVPPACQNPSHAQPPPHPLRQTLPVPPRPPNRQFNTRTRDAHHPGPIFLVHTHSELEHFVALREALSISGMLCDPVMCLSTGSEFRNPSTQKMGKTHRPKGKI